MDTPTVATLTPMADIRCTTGPANGPPRPTCHPRKRHMDTDTVTDTTTDMGTDMGTLMTMDTGTLMTMGTLMTTGTLTRR